MTPEREKYLAKCSKRELILREEIKCLRELIRDNKANRQCLKADEHCFAEERVAILRYAMHISKWKLSIYRHELARLKGMDRVVVPREAEYELTLEGHTGYCCCGNFLMENCLNKKANIHCDKCGRRILWDRIK